MIDPLIETRVQCPYCWEHFNLLVDASVTPQEYIEDCEVCCRPIDFSIEIDEFDRVSVLARSQDE